jgi:hypothetical protein
MVIAPLPIHYSIAEQSRAFENTPPPRQLIRRLTSPGSNESERERQRETERR